MARVIKTNSWQDPNTVANARALLGKLLAVRTGDRLIRRCRITEVEAYHGPEDRACHASRGRTARTEVMFGPAGRWYVYLCYGVHEMLNLVTGPAEFPAAVLIRGVQDIAGPGRLTRQLGIDRRFNALAATRSSGLWVEDDGFGMAASKVTATPRIGIDYAGSPWREKPWRFVLSLPDNTV